jgi:hypothetical protein
VQPARRVHLGLLARQVHQVLAAQQGLQVLLGPLAQPEQPVRLEHPGQQALLAHQVLRAPLGRVEVTLTRQRLRATRSQQSADLLTSPLPSMDGWRSVRRFMSGGRQQAGQPVATIT